MRVSAAQLYRASQIVGVNWCDDEYVVVSGRDDRVRYIYVEDERRKIKLKCSKLRLKAYLE